MKKSGLFFTLGLRKVRRDGKIIIEAFSDPYHDPIVNALAVIGQYLGGKRKSRLFEVRCDVDTYAVTLTGSMKDKLVCSAVEGLAHKGAAHMRKIQASAEEIHLAVQANMAELLRLNPKTVAGFRVSSPEVDIALGSVMEREGDVKQTQLSVGVEITPRGFRLTISVFPSDFPCAAWATRYSGEMAARALADSLRKAKILREA